MKRSARLVLLFIFLSFVVVTSQNCTQAANMTSGLGAATSVAESGGDGRPYEGKTYVDVSVTCSQGGVYARVEYVSAKQALLVRDNCADLTTPTSISAFVLDPVSGNLIVQARVFTPEASQGPQVQRANCDLSTFNLTNKTLSNQINYAYCLVLGRLSDGAGMSAYESDVNSGKTFPWVLTDQTGSSEFSSLYQLSSMSDGNYTILIYRLALGRDPSSAELFSGIDRLGSGAIQRLALASELYNSNEFRTLHPLLF